MKNIFLLLFGLAVFQSCKKTGIDTIAATDIYMWSYAKHNAFTDLIKYNGNYFCVFREASMHDSFNGKLRVLISSDSKAWSSLALLQINNLDLRDPHFFVDDNNVLSIGTNVRDSRNVRTNVIYKLKNNEFIKADNNKEDNDYWLWSFTRSKGNVFSIGYNIKQLCFDDRNSSKQKISLFTNLDSDCIQFSGISPDNWIPKYFECPCEASMVFTNDSTLIAIVRDEHTPGQSYIGKSRKPYTSWQWQNFPHFIRGPKLALLPDGSLFLAAASMVNYDETYYAILNPENFSIEKIMAFVSGGDTGYPGVIIEGNTALVSYYSSHQGNAKVYIERITY